MAKFRRGREAAEAAKTSGGAGRFTPTFKWSKPGDEFYLQFLTPSDDIPVIEYHNFIIVGESQDGKPIYKDFISPLDPAFADEGLDHDPLIDRFGVFPKSYNVALAVEVKPIKEGRKVVDWEVVNKEYETREGEKRVEPNVRLVMQSIFSDLFPALFNFVETKDEDITTKVFNVKQHGKGKDKKILPVEMGDAIELDFDPNEIFDWESHLESLASPERYAQYIDPLPDDAEVQRSFGGDSKKASSGRSSSQRTTRTTRTESSSEAEENEETPVATRSARFQRLKTKVGD